MSTHPKMDNGPGFVTGSFSLRQRAHGRDCQNLSALLILLSSFVSAQEEAEIHYVHAASKGL